MSDSGTWIEIALLAMLAGFIGLRLVSVLGRRTGHEKPAGEPFRPGQAEVSPPLKGVVNAPARTVVEVPSGTASELRDQLQAVADIDPRFDPVRFVAGARGAYKMVLEAFWAGQPQAMDGLVSDEVQHHFARAIEARAASGLTLDNRLVSIESAAIVAAQMIGQMAEVTVRFGAQIAGVSIAGDGTVVAGSSSDAVPTIDVWTFSRHVGSADPAWLLIATDDEA